MTASRAPSLRSHRPFQLLFGADAVSQAGTQVTAVALPLLALSALHASAFQLGLLTAAGTLAFALVSLPAGVWADRVRRRPLMIVTDLARFALLGSIPLAALFGTVTMPQLYVVALLAGSATVINDVARMSYVPFLLGRERLFQGNAALHTSREVAYSGGPAIGGWLVQLLGAAGAVVLDAVSYLVSACCVGAIRRTEPAPSPSDRPPLLRGMGQGLSYVLRHPVLRVLAGSGFVLCLATTALLAVQPVLLVRDLGLSPGAYGMVLAVDAVGGILGGLCASAARRRLGPVWAIWLPSLLTLPFVLLIPFTGHGWLLALYPLGTFAYSLGASVRNVAQLSYRQEACPPELLGRMNATMRFAMWSAMPLGGVLGGTLAQLSGSRTALWVVVALIAVAVLPVLARPVRHPADV